MTPFARYMATASRNKRQPLPGPWQRASTGYEAAALYKSFISELGTARCFECTQVIVMATDLARKMETDQAVSGRLAFLPAERTWLEFEIRPETSEGIQSYFWPREPPPPIGTRLAVYLSQKGKHECQVLALGLPPPSTGQNGGFQPWGDLLLDADEPVADFRLGERMAEAEPVEHQQALAVSGDAVAFMVYALLAIINSPKIVGHKQHTSSKVLERKLQQAGYGKRFALQPWHEIMLDVDPGPEGDEAGHTGRLTGPKALHFVRSFLRVRLGRLERVRAHFRGDATVGISQATYRLRDGLTTRHRST